MQSSYEEPPAQYLPAYRIEGSGPPLVYIAGLDGTGELLFKQMPPLAAFYRVVTFRLRERGRFTYEGLADDVAAIVRDLGEPKAVILGESFGGTVALTFALRYPEMVERLIVVNSFARFRGRVKIRLAAWLASWLPFFVTTLARCGASLLGLLADGVTRADRRRFFEAIRSVQREGYVRRLQLIAECDLEEQLSSIQAPTLFIAAEKDRLIQSVSEARRMAQRMPSAKVKVVKGVGHACLLGERVCLAEVLEDMKIVSDSKDHPA